MTKLSTATGLAAIVGALIGYAYKVAMHQREQMFETKLLEHELEILEGEGGICLS